MLLTHKAWPRRPDSSVHLMHCSHNTGADSVSFQLSLTTTTRGFIPWQSGPCVCLQDLSAGFVSPVMPSWIFVGAKIPPTWLRSRASQLVGKYPPMSSVLTRNDDEIFGAGCPIHTRQISYETCLQLGLAHLCPGAFAASLSQRRLPRWDLAAQLDAQPKWFIWCDGYVSQSCSLQ